MSSPSLTSSITAMAIRSFYEDVNFDMDSEKEARWFSHWFKTAETFCDALEKEGLTETFKAVKNIIVEQKRIAKLFGKD